MEPALETAHRSHDRDQCAMLDPVARVPAGDDFALLMELDCGRARGWRSRGHDELESATFIRDRALGVSQGQGSVEDSW
jgi:hypothetical protein